MPSHRWLPSLMPGWSPSKGFLSPFISAVHVHADCFSELISVLFLLAYENEDQLLWDPNILPEREVEEFLYRAVKRRWDELSSSSLPEGEMVKDNEQVNPCSQRYYQEQILSSWYSVPSEILNEAHLKENGASLL